MKLHIISWNVKGLNGIDKRRIIKSPIQEWREDIYCFQKTNLEGDCGAIVRRWADYVGLEVNGKIGGILIIWDKPIHKGELISTGFHIITCKTLLFTIISNVI